MYPYEVVGKGTVEVTCPVCGNAKQIEVGEAGLKRLEESDMLIQRAIPHVPPEFREMLISGTCPDCFKAMFATFEEDEEDI
mgnify:FL=1